MNKKTYKRLLFFSVLVMLVVGGYLINDLLVVLHYFAWISIYIIGRIAIDLKFHVKEYEESIKR